MKTQVLIIGGGLAGLACAVALSRAGVPVTVVEKEEVCGGRARSWPDERTGDTVDIGPHILLNVYHNMLRLLGDLGTADEIFWQKDKFLTVAGKPRPAVIRARRLPAPLSFLPSMLSIPQLSLRDIASGARFFRLVIRLREEDILALDARDAESLIREMGVSPRFLDWFWRTACMTIMNVPLEECSAGAFVRFLRFMLGRSSFQVGFPLAGLGELFVPGSRRCIEAAGGHVLRGTAASLRQKESGQVAGVLLDDGTRVDCEVCVAALPPAGLLALLPADWKTSPPHGGFFSPLARITPSAYLCSYLWFDRKLTHERFWTRVWGPGNLNYDFYDLSNIRRGWKDRPSLIASNVMYSQRIAGMGDGEVLARTLDELADFLPDAKQARLLHHRLHRVPMGIPAPYPGSEAARPPNRTPVPNLLLAGDWTRAGLPSCMEAAARSGFLAAEAVLADLGRPRTIALPPPRLQGLVRLINPG